MADVQVLRQDFGAFCEAVGRPREPFQLRSFSLKKRITAVVAPRQSGKSETLALLALWWAYRSPSQRILIVSAGDEASKRLLALIRQIATGSPLLAGSVVDEQSGLLTLTNGSRIKAVPASERQIRGETADLLIIDEAALVSDDVGLGAAFPTAAAREHARILLCSSAGPANGFFFDHVQVGLAHSEHVDADLWDIEDCWWVTPSTRESLRVSLGPQRFDAEVRNIFGGMSDTLLTRLILDPCCGDYLADHLDSMLPAARVTTGHDHAMSGPDFNAMTAIGCMALRDRRQYAVRMTHRWPTGVPIHQVVADVAGSPAHYDAMNSETNGLGGPITEQLWRAIYNRPRGMGGGNPAGRGWVVVEERGDVGEAPPPPRRRPPAQLFTTVKRPIFTTAALKASIFSALRLLLERRWLLIPASADDLIRELLLLKVDLTATGTEKIEARSGHDDLAMSLALALTPYKDENGAWRTRVMDWADPTRFRLPLPLLPAAMDRLEMVPAGDVLVPRTPAWVSVRGAELTLPSDLDLVDPSLRSLRRRVNEAVSTNQQEANHATR
jgi:hypothetical protein